MKSIVTLSTLAIATCSFGQFPSLKWQYPLPAPAFGSAAAADLDKDGKLEIVFSTYTADGKLHCLNAENGTARWVFNIGGCGDVAPLVADVDKDDTLDVVVNGSCNPVIFCVNGYTGRLKWSKPSGGGDSPPSLYDMDGDGRPEILFGNFAGEIRILNAEDGSTDKVIKADKNNRPIQTEIVATDVEPDGDMDLLAASHVNVDSLRTWCFDYKTTTLNWTYSLKDSSTYNAYHGGALADLDGDGKLDYTIGSNNGRVTALRASNGSELWVRQIPSSCMGAINVADLNRDGIPEVVLINNDWRTFDERIWVLDGKTGNTRWSYDVPLTSFRGCAIGDINGNDTLDLVSGHYMGNLTAVEPFTGLLWQTNLKPLLKSGLPYFDVNHGPLLADFDQNGTMDVFTVAGYGTYTPDSLNCGVAVLYEAGAGTCPSWLMFRQDVQRSGYLSPQDIAAQCPLTAIPSNPASASLLYPSPASNELYFAGSAPSTLNLTNTTGQHFSLLVQAASVNTLHLPSGIYIAQWTYNQKHFRQVLTICHQ